MKKAIAFSIWLNQNCDKIEDGWVHEGNVFYTDSGGAMKTLYHSFTLSEYYTNTFGSEYLRRQLTS